MRQPKMIKFLSLLLLSSLCLSMLFSCSGIKFKVEFIVDEEIYKTASTRDKDDIAIPKNPEKEGFEFDGWYLKNGERFTVKALLDTPISDDMVLKVYAKFVPITEETDNFLFKACDGGYEVIGYTGDDAIVTIPSAYKGQPVLAVGRDPGNKNGFAENQRIEEIIVPNGVTRISSSAFRHCKNLKRLTLPDSITEVGYDAFFGCEKLTDVTLPAEQVRNIPKQSLTTVVINGGTAILGYSEGFYNCKNLVSVTIADSVTRIEWGAFNSCENLTAIRLPSGITEIPEHAFTGCKSLTSITIPDGVTTIGSGAFANCERLNNVIIPARVNSIGKYVFQSCKSLTSLTFQDPNGWHLTYGQAVESRILSDPASAAEYLNEFDYCTFQRN